MTEEHEHSGCRPDQCAEREERPLLTVMFAHPAPQGAIDLGDSYLFAGNAAIRGCDCLNPRHVPDLLRSMADQMDEAVAAQGGQG